MRTTLTLDDDAFEAASAYARSRSLRLGQAVSELIRRAHQARIGIVQEGEVWVFDLPSDAPRVTAAQVEELLDETL
jgi:hypothetical protein